MLKLQREHELAGKWLTTDGHSAGAKPAAENLGGLLGVVVPLARKSCPMLSWLAVAGQATPQGELDVGSVSQQLPRCVRERNPSLLWGGLVPKIFLKEGGDRTA